MDENEVRKGVVAGVALALKRAHKWSNGRAWPGDSGAENLLQVSIAEKLYGSAEKIPPVIVLEMTLARLGIKGSRRRIDVALMRHADNFDRPHPFCVVEVKKAPATFKEDIKKINDLLTGVATIKYAFLATYFQHYCYDKSRARTCKQFVDDLDQTVHRAAKAYPFICCSLVEKRFLGKPMLDDGGGRHQAGALIHRFGR